MAIFPFIRQFRIADPDWYDNYLGIYNIKFRLNYFLDTKIFKNIMKKYEPWKNGDEVILFP